MKSRTPDRTTRKQKRRSFLSALFDFFKPAESFLDFFRPAKKARMGRMMRMEPLEGRQLLTSYIVDTNIDNPAGLVGDMDGAISLREAINAANSGAAFGDAPAGDANGDSITFQLVAGSETITLDGVQLPITDDLSINGDNNLGLGSGTNVTVSGNNLSRVFDINVGQSVNLSNLTATAGNALGADGGAIRIAGGATANLSNVSVTNSTLASFGGGISVDGSTVTLTNGTIVSGNSAGRGGGVSASLSSTLIINGGTISGNTAAIVGGGVYNSATSTTTIDGATITGNEATGNAAIDGGGGVFNDNTLIIQNNAMITNNIASGTLGSGGGVLNNDSLTVTGSTISGNRANRAGGGIEVTANSTSTLTNITLTNNNAGVAPAVAAPGNGGGLHITGAASVTFNGGLVDGNVAAAEGGGLWNSATGTLNLFDTAATDLNITENVAQGNAAIGVGGVDTQGGGGVFNDGGTLTINGSVGTPGTRVIFNGNQATGSTNGSGGGILSIGGAVGITYANVILNEAVRAGGGIEVIAGTVTIANTNIANNDVSTGGALAAASPGNGGGLHVTGAAIVNISASSFSANVAATEGGGVWNSSTGSMTLSTVFINGNVASGTAANDGGGGVFNNGGTLVIEDSLINANEANGASGSGGGLFNNTGGTVTITDSTIQGNTANRAGGGIEDNAGSLITIVDSTIRNNNAGVAPAVAAPGNGGGIHITGAGKVTIDGSTIHNNTAKNEGGGIWNSGTGTYTITNSTISTNSVTTGPGGGVFNVAGGAISLDSVTITLNTATTTGGGIGGGTGVTLRNTIVAQNTVGVSEQNLGPATIANTGFNLIGDPDNGTLQPPSVTNIFDADAMLGNLMNNGGPTLTHRPFPGSPAIGFGNTTLTVDQRNVARPQGGADDIGAVEVDLNGEEISADGQVAGGQAGDGNPDEFRIINGPGPNNVTVFANGVPNTFDRITTGQLLIFGSSDDDTLIVDNSNGLVGQQIVFFGDGGRTTTIPQVPQGAGFDKLQLVGDTSADTIYNPGETNDAGAVLQVANEFTQRVEFFGLEPVQVVGTGAGDTLTVAAAALGAGFPQALNANNAINYSEGPNSNDPFNPVFLGDLTGLVTVDGFESIEFSNFGTLVIDAGAGSDEISINNLTMPTALTDIEVNGGDPTAGSDSLVVNSVAGDPNYRPTDDGAGVVELAALPDVTFSETEHVTLVGLTASPDLDGLNYVAPPGAGADTFEYTPGTNADEGRITGFRAGTAGFNFTTLDFIGLRRFLQIVSNDVNDTVIANGTVADSVFNVSDSVTDPDFQAVIVDGHTELIPASSTVGNPVLVLRGLGGNDTFNVDFDTLSIRRASSIRVEGGDSDGSSDVLNFTGSGGDVTLDLTAQSLTEAGLGPVSFSGVENININANGGQLLAIGTAGDDTFAVQPTAAGAGNFTASTSGAVVASHPQFTYTDATTFTLNGGSGGFDILGILGNESADTITSTATTVTRAGGTVTLGAGLERLDISTFGGNDMVTLSGLTIATIADGGAGNDTVNGGGMAAGFTAFGGDGNDTLTGGSGSDVLNGGDGRDTITGGTGTNNLTGGAEADVINSAGQGDFVDGGPSIDAVNVNGGAGDYLVSTFFGTLVSVSGPGALSAQVVGAEELYVGSITAAANVTVRDLTGTDVRELGANGSRSSSSSSTFLGAASTITLVGTAADDNITIARHDTGPSTDVLLPWGRVQFQGIVQASLIINGDDGNDVIEVAPNAFGAGQPTITLNGEAGNDVLAGNAGINILSGGDGDDTLTGGSGNNTLDGGAGNDTYIPQGGTDSVSDASGIDVILMNGTAGNDSFNIIRTGIGDADLQVTINGVITTFSGYATVATGLEGIIVNGLTGADLLTVDSTNGAVQLPIEFAGDGGNDQLNLFGGTATSNFFFMGPNPGDGTSTISIAGQLQRVKFSGLEPVIDTVAGPIQILATDADNAITFNGNAIAVDDQEDLLIGNKTDVSILGLGGSDTFSVNNPFGFSGSLFIDGGEPTASDTVIVNGTSGIDNVTIDQLTLDGGRVTGLGPTINVTTVEHLMYSGNGGNDILTVTTPANGQVITVTPGSVPGEGSIAMRNFTAIQGNPLLPINFTGISANGRLAFADVSGARVDDLRLFGTSEANIFRLNAAGDSTLVALAAGGENVKRIPVLTPGIANLTLNGLDGDDIFEVPGSHPFTNILVDGGDPSASDVLSFTGSGANPITADFGATLVQEATFGPVDFIGVETLNVNAAGEDLAINATAGNDTLSVTPTGTNTATAALTASAPSVGATPVLNGSNIGTYSVNLLGGFDLLVVNGLELADVLTIDGDSVENAGEEIVNYLGAEALTVNGLGGNDTFAVTASGVRTFVDGGNPIGVVGDRLTLTVPAGAGPITFQAGPESDEGGFSFGGGLQQVSYDHIEAVGPIDLTTAGGVLNIVATNADNDINIVGVDADSVTVSIDGGPAIQYDGVTTLNVDALAGDDDIDVTVGPLTITAINITGNDPTASDILLINGTSGADIVTFTATSASAGSLTGLNTPVNFNTTEHVVFNGLGGGDTLNVVGTAANDTLTFAPTEGTGTFSSSQSPSLSFQAVLNVSVTGGAGGFDVAEITGSAGIDTITTAANVVSLAGAGTLTLGADMDRLVLSTLGGNDSINASGVSVPVTVFAGDGNDTVTGSPQDDLVFGGFGNDILVGGAGSDTQHGEEGQDTIGNLTLTADGVANDAGIDFNFGGPGFDNFVWEPGDGADFNNGGEDAADIFRFFGNAADNVFELRQGGTPTHLNAVFDPAGVNITIDNHGVEDIVVEGLAGADTITVQDLYATEVVAVNVNVGANDAAVDSVTVNGRNVADDISVSLLTGRVRVQGLTYNVDVTNSVVTDTLTVNGNDGDDAIRAVPGVQTQIDLTFNGNQGNDLLVGSPGNDTLDGGAGDDTFVGSGGTDEIEGGVGSFGDTILLPGTAGNDAFRLSLNVTGHLVSVINGVTTVYTGLVGGGIDLTGVELLRVEGLEGNDTLDVDNSNGLISIPVQFNGGSGADLLRLFGTTSANTIYNPGATIDSGVITQSAGITTQTVSFTGLEPVQILGTGPQDTLTIGSIVSPAALNANNSINYLANGPTSDAGLFTGFDTAIVSVDGYETLEFSNFGLLNINAGAGDDVIHINHGSLLNATLPTNLNGINVDGGDPTASDEVIVSGFSPPSTITFTPTGPDSGNVAVTGQPTVTFTTTESVVINGLAGNDNLVVVTPPTADTITYTPGPTVDSASVQVGSLVPMRFTNLGTAGGPITFNDSNTRGASDILIYNGTAADDTFSVTATGDIRLNSQLLVTTPGIEFVVLNGFDGNDTFNIAGNHPFDGITLAGGGPSASDVVNFNGSGNEVTVDFEASRVQESGFGPVTLSGVEVLNANATAASATFLGTAGNDTIDVSPTGTDALTVRLTGSNPDVGSTPVVNFSNVGATMTVDGGVGSDGLVFNGTANPDTILLSRVANTLQLNGGQVVTSVSNATWTVNSGESDDSITVTDGAIAFNIPITVNAGSGAADTLTNSTGFSTTYRPGTERDAGFLVAVATALQIGYAGIDAVTVSYTAPANTGTIDAGPGANQITVTGTAASTVVATVDNGSPVTFTGATLTTINVLAGSGDDVISVTPGTFTGAGGINVTGGDPTAESDTLIVTATSGNDTLGYLPSDTIGSGQVTRTGVASVNFTTIEAVTIDGQGGTDALTHTTPDGIHPVTYTPGAAPDAGTIATRKAGSGTTLVPLSFRQIGAGGNVTFASVGGREDILELNGTNNSDIFIASGLNVRIVSPTNSFVTVALNTGGINTLQMRGLDGDDVFNVQNTLPYAGGTYIDGGDPSASDIVNLAGAAGAVTVNLEAQTVTGYGGTIFFLGVEEINANANANAMTVVGTAADDSITVTVASATSGQVTNGISLTRLGEPPQTPVAPVVNYTNITGSLIVDLAGGEDTLAVVGNALSQTFNINDDEAPFIIDLPGGYGPVVVPANTVQVDDGNDGLLIDGAVTWLNNESLQVAGLEGNDTFHVIPVAGPPATFVPGTSIPIFVDGGDPIGNSAGDRLVAFGNGNPVLLEPGPESDEGGIVYGNPERVSFDHIEAVTIVQPTSVIILGTNGDDDITVIARDFQATDNPSYPGTDGIRDFTVAVNDGLEVLYIDVGGIDPGPGVTIFGELHIDGLAGDDDIVIRAPARNQALWSMQVEVAGGPPSDGADNEGDRLVLETPGADTVFYTPTGSDTGIVLIDENANTTFEAGDTQILIGPFFDADPPIAYDSSPGGVELFEYDGEGANDSFTIIGTAGSNTIVHTPGVGTDEGTLRVDNFLGVNYQNLGAGGILTASGGTAGTDTLVYDGTSLNDQFTVAPTTGAITLANSHGTRLALSQTSIEALALNGFDGDDTFNIAGPQPYATTSIAAGGPSASDVVNLTGDGTAMTVTLAIIPVTTTEATVIGGGLGAISLSGVETANVANGAGAVTVQGEDGDDRMVVTPSNLLDTATIQANSLKPVVNATTTGALTVAGGASTSDTLVYNGRAVADTIAVTGTTITHTGFKTITYDATSELLEVNADGGNDTVTLAGVAIPTTIDAGSGNDTVTGSATVTASLTIFGRDGDDTLTGGNVADTIYGGFGNDILIGGAGNDTQYGEEGQDIFGNPTLAANSVADDAGDDFNFGGPGFDNFVWEPGDGADFNNGGEDAADIFRFFGDANPNTFELRQGGTPTHLNAAFGAVVIDNHGVEDIVISGLGGADTFTVQDIYATEVVTVNLDVGAADAAIDAVTVNGRNVDDNIQVSSLGGQVRVQGLRYNVNVTNSVAVDTLTINGNDGNDVITAAQSLETQIALTLNGNLGNDFLTADATLNGNEGNDRLIGGAGNNTISGGAGDDVIDGRGGTNTIDGGADTDTILVSGTAGPEAITTTHGAGTFAITGGLSAGTNNITTMEAVRVEAGDGADAITLNLLAAGGLNYTVLGGNPIAIPGDTLTVNTPSDIDFLGGPENDSGAFAAATTSPTNISFDEIESASVVAVGPGVDSTFWGTSGDDDITVQATSATAFTVAMGGTLPVSYSGLASFTVNGKEGDDDITVAPITPNNVALTVPITVIGDSPTAATGDQLLVEGSSASETIAVNLTAGTVTVGTAAAITFNTTELLAISALGGTDTLAITGSSNYEYTPAVALDAGTIQTTNLPIAFTGLFLGETITLAGVGEGDNLIANGTLTNDTFTVAAASGNVVVNSRVTLSPTGIETLTLNGLDGDDTFTVGGPLPYSTTNINAGGPSASDVANLTGDGTAVTVTLAIIPVSTTDATVTGGGLGLVNLSGVETANVANGGGPITVQGEDGDDRMVVTPSNLPDTATIQANELKPIVNATTTGTLTVAGGATNADTLVYNGRTVSDTIAVDATTITHTGFKTITYDATIELLEVNSSGGDDTVTVTDVTIPSTVDAGSGNDTVTGSSTVTAPMIIFGRDGDDTLTGGNVADTIYGGFGNDILIGGAGNDSQYGEEGQDIFGNPTLNSDGIADDPGSDFNFGGPGFDNFVWEPGDGPDSNNGGEDAADIFRVFGSAAGNVFDLRQGGTPTHLNVEIDGVVVDNHGIEDIVVGALGGPDTLTVQDIYATEVVAVNLNLGPADAAPDTVTINGRNVADEVSIVSPSAGTLDVNGLRYNVRVSSIGLTDPDDFTFNANGGNDVVTTADDLSALFASSNVAANNHFTIDGGAGDDVLSTYGELLGGDGNDILTGFTSTTLANFSQIIDGGSGNDQIRGGTGLDALTGGPGDDTFVPGFDLLNDTVDGGTGFDTILIEGTSFNDRIDVIQDSPTQVRYNLLGVNGGGGVIPGAVSGTETDLITSGSIEEVKVQAGAGDDQIRVTHHDSLIANTQQALSVRFTVEGGAPGASDRLTVADNGIGDVTIHRVGAIPGTGSYQIGTLQPVVYYDVEFTSLITTDLVTLATVPSNPILGGYGTDGVGRLYVFKADPYEANNTLQNASYLGSGPTINVDPTIDPGFDLPFGAAGDEDWYRIVAQTTGDLDVRVFFRGQGQLSNTRAGLPGNGNLDIALYDLDGIITGFPTGGAIAGVGTFGSNENAAADSDERVRIPVVAGQTYYLRVRGAPAAGPLTNANGATSSDSLAVNVYSISVLNTPAVTPYGGEIDDIIATSAVVGAATATQFNGGAALSALDDFYNGKDIYFTSGPLNGQRGRVVDYVGATKTFTFAAFTFTAAPVAGDTFQIESFDTGRSQLENITRDATPIIRFRLDDAIYLQDVPGNPAPLNQLDPGQGIIAIPFSGNALAQRETNSITGVNAGFRVAIFDEGPPQQPGQLPQVPVGYARQIAEGVYEFDFERDRIVGGVSTPFTLTDGSHFLSARVQMVDPSNPNASGFGDRSQLLEIVVDTQVPPAFFGLPNVPDDGLLPDSDTGINPNQHTLSDRVTSDTTPGFFGQAEADAVIRLFIDLNADGTANPDGTGDGIFQPAVDFQIGFAVAQPFDGTNQYPVGYWQVDAINFNLNAAPFPQDGQRTIFLTAEDVAGNINPAQGVIRFDLFIDTQGPQVTDVTINGTAQLLGLTPTNSLVRFNSDAPNVILSTTPVANLGGNTLVAIDVLPVPRGNVRPGTLFGLGVNAAGTSAQMYAIVPATGFAMTIGNPFAVTPSTGYGLDFNPTSGLLRIVNSSNENFRFDVATGIVTVDPAIAVGSDLVGSAYDRNDTDPDSPTTLFGIDSTSDTLVRQGGVNGVPSPNGGAITLVGSLGLNTDENVGFDIARGTNTAFAALRVGATSGLYTLNLATGEADLVGTIGTGSTIVGLTVLPAYDLFDPKPSTDGPTPPVNSLVISFRDLPARTQAFLIEALKEDVADTPGIYQVIGDHNGIIPIVEIIVINQPPMAGQPALATVELVFRKPGPDGVFNTADDIGATLPDDRYTLIVNDNIIDLAGNHLDGESNASEPQEFPSFPSGDGLPGGDFVARFTIDSRPELGNYGAGSAFIDINGNLLYDPQGDDDDYTNRDLVFQIGTVSDSLFAGKFEPAALAQNDNDGFDKLGAYGYDNFAKEYRFLLDFNHDGAFDLRIVSAFQVNAIAVAGNFAASHPGDELGLFDGKNWYLDTNGDNVLDLKIVSNMRGNPIVGDFNGDGFDDLATYDAGLNQFFFDTNRDGQSDDSLAIGGPLNGFTDLPVAGDYNLDGIDDLGVWVPNRQGSTTATTSEWFFLVSDRIGQALPSSVFDAYAPTPLGNDVYAEFGDHFSLPIFGNFDPPVADSVSSTPSQTNSLNPLDVDRDGYVAPNDALLVINQLNSGAPIETNVLGLYSNYLDVDGDDAVAPSDALEVINYLNSYGGDSGAEGESVDSALSDLTSDSLLDDDLLNLIASDSLTTKRKSSR